MGLATCPCCVWEASGGLACCTLAPIRLGALTAGCRMLCGAGLSRAVPILLTAVQGPGASSPACSPTLSWQELGACRMVGLSKNILFWFRISQPLFPFWYFPESYFVCVLLQIVLGLWGGSRWRAGVDLRVLSPFSERRNNLQVQLSIASSLGLKLHVCHKQGYSSAFQ